MLKLVLNISIKFIAVLIPFLLLTGLIPKSKELFPEPPGTKRIAENKFIDIKLLTYSGYYECLNYIKNIEKDTLLHQFLILTDTTIRFNDELLWMNKKFEEFPIVGINKQQIEKYCEWRSKVVNIFKNNPEQRCSNPKYWKKYDKIDPNMNYDVFYYLPTKEELSFISIKEEVYHYDEITQEGIVKGLKKIGLSDESQTVFRCAAKFIRK